MKIAHLLSVNVEFLPEHVEFYLEHVESEY